ncbi:MAG: hypothetical protein IJ762_09515 [Bacteroidaceae bacterium]|nr:hypothetical protein [Bacteroidaceae bacterium]
MNNEQIQVTGQGDAHALDAEERKIVDTLCDRATKLEQVKGWMAEERRRDKWATAAQYVALSLLSMAAGMAGVFLILRTDGTEVPIPESEISKSYDPWGDEWDTGEAVEEDAVWDSLSNATEDGDTIN